jgi:opacity protein-like surface antigen
MQLYSSKTALIGLFVLSFFPAALFSQTYSNKESSILSFTAGVTSSNLVNDSIHYKPGIMFHGGLAYSLMLNDRLNAAVELQYAGKAFRNESPIVKYRYFFADIPLYLQIKLGENIRFNAGVQYSIATNSQMITIDPTKTNGVNSVKVNAAKPTDFGFLGGMEFDVSKSFAIGARYTISASTFFQKNEVNFGVFQVSLKYSPIKTYQVFFHKKETQQ